MEKTGIVMEVGDSYAIVLTRDGEFCRLPAGAELTVGMEVAWEVRQTSSGSRRLAWPRWIRRGSAARPWQRWSAAGLAACVALGMGLWQLLHPAPAQAYALVSLDINPSVVLQVDRGLHVIAAQWMNPDGQALLRRVHVVGDPMVDAVKELLDVSAAEHMLGVADSILVTTSPAQQGMPVDPLRQQIQSAVESALAHDSVTSTLHPAVYTLGISPAVWSAAERAHIPPGRLAAYIIARSEGYAGTVAELQGTALKQFLEAPQAQAVAETLASTDVQKIEAFLSQMQGTGSSSYHGSSQASTASTSETTGGLQHTDNATPLHIWSGPAGTNASSESAADRHTVSSAGDSHSDSDAARGHKSHEKAHGGAHGKAHASDPEKQHRHTRTVTVSIGDVEVSVPVEGVTEHVAAHAAASATRLANDAVSAVSKTVNSTLGAVGHVVNSTGETVEGFTHVASGLLPGIKDARPHR